MSKKKEIFEFPLKTKKNLALGILIGVACLVWAFLSSPDRAWINYLTNAFYFVSLSLSGMVFLAISNLSKASWVVPFKRIPESLAAFLPVGLLIMIGLIFGIHNLYEWSHHDVVAKDAILSGKAAYLNTTGFVIRMGVFFFLWIVISAIMKRVSDEQGSGNDELLSAKLQKWSAIFLIAFTFSYSLASIDWIMSLKPHWFSTIFGIYNFSGLFVNGIAVITLMLIWLQDKGYLSEEVTKEHFHDLGKFMFGFSTFWAYIWLSQYLLIWYANIPEETMYFVTREHHNWDWLFFFNVGINWIVPFFALMSYRAKRSPFVLFRVAVVLIIGRWLDIYLMVAPDVYEHAGVTDPQIGLIEVGVSIGFASLFILVIGLSLQKRKLAHKADPLFLEGATYKQ